MAEGPKDPKQRISAMIRYVTKAWFRRRWHVYSMGDSLTRTAWLATFRSRSTALWFASQGTIVMPTNLEESPT